MKNMWLDQTRAPESRAASAVIPRFAVHVPLLRRDDASIALAMRFCESPIGLMNSLKRTFPG
jgi:hypothetical protein